MILIGLKIARDYSCTMLGVRSPGYGSGSAADAYGYGYGYYFGDDVDYDYYAVRPAWRLALSSSAPLSYAGMVCSDGTVADVDGYILTPTPTSSPTATSINKLKVPKKKKAKYKKMFKGKGNKKLQIK